MEMLYTWDIRSELGRITAPTLIIHRRDNRAFPPENGRTLAAGINNSRAVIIDGFAHLPPDPGDPHTIDVINEILGFITDGTQVVAVQDKPNIHTILFTDVEGSTDLIERLGDEAGRQAMREHDDISQTSVTMHGGTVIKTTGDGLMATFPSASGAIDASIHMQQQLHERTTLAEAPIRIRVGIHAGEPIEEEADLHGTSVIRASRIMAAAQGDQILISSVVKELVAGRDYELTSQGMHPLKGITEPIQLFEVEWRTKSEQPGNRT